VPKVSVITAAYNHVAFIRQSIESALSQTYRDFEHIVVDDGTTDGTAEVLHTFGNQIKYIRQDNRGAHAAINTGIRASTGEYIAILDSDDAWLPQKLERQMAAFDERPDAGMVYSQARIMYKDGDIDPNLIIGEPLDPVRPFEGLLINNRIPALTALIKRSCLDDVGSFLENLKGVADWELWLRISSRWPIAFVPEPLAIYRVHGRNTYHQLVQSGHLIRERLLVLKDIRAAAFGDPHETRQKRRTLEVMYTFTALGQAYVLGCRRHYLKAVNYLWFALRNRPALVWDIPAAFKLVQSVSPDRKPRHLIANLVFGQEIVSSRFGLK
jgi:glycosyltransferase involved in cell wall biosynthesis